MQRIIEIIKTLSKKALSFRGHSNESANSLNDEPDNHGKFLSIIQLMAKFDPALLTHVNKVQENYNKRHLKLKLDGKKGSKGRGALVTFISKITVNTIVNILKTMLQKSISAEVKLAKIYSI